MMVGVAALLYDDCAPGFKYSKIKSVDSGVRARLTHPNDGERAGVLYGGAFKTK